VDPRFLSTCIRLVHELGRMRMGKVGACLVAFFQARVESRGVSATRLSQCPKMNLLRRHRLPQWLIDRPPTPEIPEGLPDVSEFFLRCSSRLHALQVSENGQATLFTMGAVLHEWTGFLPNHGLAPGHYQGDVSADGMTVTWRRLSVS
jgi:hypothetical protein